MIKAESRKNKPPSKEETHKQYKIWNPDPHGQETFKRNCCILIIKRRIGGYGKRNDHDQKVKGFIGIDLNLAVWVHARSSVIKILFFGFNLKRYEQIKPLRLKAPVNPLGYVVLAFVEHYTEDRSSGLFDVFFGSESDLFAYFA